MLGSNYKCCEASVTKTVGINVPDDTCMYAESCRISNDYSGREVSAGAYIVCSSSDSGGADHGEKGGGQEEHGMEENDEAKDEDERGDADDDEGHESDGRDDGDDTDDEDDDDDQDDDQGEDDQDEFEDDDQDEDVIIGGGEDNTNADLPSDESEIAQHQANFDYWTAYAMDEGYRYHDAYIFAMIQTGERALFDGEFEEPKTPEKKYIMKKRKEMRNKQRKLNLLTASRKRQLKSRVRKAAVSALIAKVVVSVLEDAEEYYT